LEGILQWLLEVVENRLVARADHVFTVDSVNDALERRYERFNKNVTVIYNVPDIDVDVDESLVCELREAYGNECVLTYVGGIMWEKGSLRMVDVVNELSHKLAVRLVLVGRFKNSEAEVRQIIRDNELESTVDIIDWVPFEEMLAYLHVSDIALALHQPTEFYQIYPSKGTGAKFFNYMQASLPIVAPEFGEIGDVVSETGCGVLVDTTDTAAVVAAIQDLVEGDPPLDEIGARGRAAVDESYNWDDEKRKVRRVYDVFEGPNE
jgi:glycosyltransferase involved in cell wall biosynthesis